MDKIEITVSVSTDDYEKIESLQSMMQSCFTYGQLSKENEYISKRIDALGSILGNSIYDAYKEYLEANFRIEKNVYTDSEGLTYNSLVKIN